MSEQPVPPEHGSEVSLSVGRMLRIAREEAGLSQQQVAEKMHLRPQNIQDMEQDIFDPAVSLTFTKGYLKLYARHVSLPEQQVLDAFMAQHQDNKEPAKLQSFSRRVTRQANDARLMMITYGVLILVVALVVLWWFQQPDDSEVGTGITTDQVAQPVTSNGTDKVSQAGEEAHSAYSNDTHQALLPESSQQSSSGTQLAETTDAASAPGGSTQSQAQTAGQAAADSAAAEAVQAVLPASNSASGITEDEQEVNLPEPVELIFEFSADCWMNLTDASGEAIAYGVKKAGRVMPVSGIPPFQITLGAPAAVQLSYNGQAVDLSRFSATSSARFRLNENGQLGLF